MEASFYALHDELFPIFLWIAIGLLIIDIFILERKISWLDKITFFRKEDK
jgi:Ca-activated chloride channel family protein